MSISLNDHENRIKVLENTAHNSNLKITRLATVNKDTVSKIVLSQPVDDFDMIVVHSGSDAKVYRMINIHLPSTMETNASLRLAGTDNDFWVSKLGSDRKTLTTVEERSFLFWIDGLKWGGGINLGTLLQRLLVYIKTYSKLFHLQFLEVK